MFSFHFFESMPAFFFCDYVTMLCLLIFASVFAHLCVCVCVCLYVCLSVCLSVCMYVCMYVCMVGACIYRLKAYVLGSTVLSLPKDCCQTGACTCSSASAAWNEG